MYLLALYLSCRDGNGHKESITNSLIYFVLLLLLFINIITTVPRGSSQNGVPAELGAVGIDRPCPEDSIDRPCPEELAVLKASNIQRVEKICYIHVV